MAKTPTGPKEAPKTKQSTLMGFFGKPKTGPIPRISSSSSQTLLAADSAPGIASTSASSPVSTNLKTPSSAAGSSPLTAASASRRKERQSSPLKKPSAAVAGEAEEEEEDLTPPPEETLGSRTGKKESVQTDTEIELDDPELEIEIEQSKPEPDSPVVTGRRMKRKVVYAESEYSDDDLLVKAGTGSKSRPRKSFKASSDDEFEFDDGDDAAFAAVAEEFEAHIDDSPSPSIRSESPAPRKKTTKSGSTIAAPRPSLKASAARPGPRPIKDSNGESAHSSNNLFLTKAERRKADEKESKSQNEEVFAFLKDVKDAQGRPKDHPDYDKRTLYIAPKQLEALKPFEKQFWRIKKDHFDTVLFFQKGKFYELYEDDAMIGHQEFDLKLTERVRMRMVGVPEQQFDLWANKFLGNGYKVGRVDQAETALGAEMRKAGEKNGAKAKPAKGKKGAFADDDDDSTMDDGSADKIVRRELAQVFTNGTIVDGVYLTDDEANHCVSIKEYEGERGSSSFGVCTLDASTGEFNLSAFADDACSTKLETIFRQIRPKELLYAKGNLSVKTQRLLRSVLPSTTLWQSFQPLEEFYTADETLVRLAKIFETEDDEPGSKPELPEAIEKMLENPLAMEALGGMLFYLNRLNLDKDLVTQKNFNIYDPIREGKNLALDGQTLGHMEVLVNEEGGTDGTLLEIMQRCVTPFGKRLFRTWLEFPLREISAINARLDAVDDLIKYSNFTGEFTKFGKGLPDLERLLSRIHAGSVKQIEFTKVTRAFQSVQQAFESLSASCESFESSTVGNLLRSAPDLGPLNDHIGKMFTTNDDEISKTMQIVPRPDADAECDEADAEVAAIDAELQTIMKALAQKLKLHKSDCCYWSTAQGGKDIYQLQIPAGTKVPLNWAKQSGTKKVERYYTPETIPVIRQFQEAKERQNTAKRTFFLRLLAEFDKDRQTWLQAVKVISELDCLVSLAKASSTLDEPRCRPIFIESDSASIDFEDLRHPSMCLRSNFISNDVQLGGQNNEPRQVLLTGPNMAGKSTLLRMTAAGIIMAQMGCYVPASKAIIAPVDRIQTRMGAYDNMFANASTFKVELDECSKILREAGPRSFVVLDELGRGTSTYDGMAIAGAVLHHLATETLPLGFFATHYGSLTDDYAYHPNIRRMHMQTHVDDEQMQVVFLYKLIPGVAESSHGTHVARMAGVDEQVVRRADKVSAEFFEAFKAKLEKKRQSALPIVALADFAWLIRTAATGGKQNGDGSANANEGDDVDMDVENEHPAAKDTGMMLRHINLIKDAVGKYEEKSVEAS